MTWANKSEQFPYLLLLLVSNEHYCSVDCWAYLIETMLDVNTITLHTLSKLVGSVKLMLEIHKEVKLCFRIL